MTISMDDEQLLRYSRQIMLPAIDVEGQSKLLSSTVLIIGLGGLGSPVAMYLASAGVGKLILCDDDKVDLSNLQRQIAHHTADIGIPKTQSAKNTLLALNPDICVETHEKRLGRDELVEQVKSCDVVVDASDNFETRFLLNEVCVELRKPLVSGAAIRMEGQVTVFSNKSPQDPCYRCLYRDQGEIAESCSESGVLSPIVGLIGSIQALETLKLLTNVGDTLNGRLLVFDGATMEVREIRLKKDPKCPVCSH
ncbi:HesA/MoeB/ThiF family protein [Kaarinaea lacus]